MALCSAVLKRVHDNLTPSRVRLLPATPQTTRKAFAVGGQLRRRVAVDIDIVLKKLYYLVVITVLPPWDPDKGQKNMHAVRPRAEA